MKESKLNDVTQIGVEVVNSPKFAAGLSAYLLGVNWVELFSESFKYASSFIAFITLIVVLRNHILTHKKLKMELEILAEKNKKGGDDGETSKG